MEQKIISLLESKTHNPRYLKRYIRYIDAAIALNENLEESTYTETHHICPKAKSLFPEYKDLRENKWNAVRLTGHQHIFAHILLWKVYGSSQTYAVEYFFKQNSDTNPGLHGRKIPSAVKIRYAAKIRESANDARRGFGTYLDSDLNRFYLHRDSPKIKELGLVGHKKGVKSSKEVIDKIRKTRYKSRRVLMYFLDAKVRVSLFSDEFSEYLAQGWSMHRSEDDRAWTAGIGYGKIAEFWTGRAKYMTRDGVFHGAYLENDPAISEFDLVIQRTEAQITQNASRVGKATAAKLGRKIYTNGTEERFLTGPEEGWTLGRAPRSKEWEAKRRSASVKSCSGSVCWTDGFRNYLIQPGDPVPEGLRPGMKHRDNVTYYYKCQESLYSFHGKHSIPSGFIRIGAREFKSLSRL